MKKIIIYSLILFSSSVYAQTLQQLQGKKVLLPNGWSLTPAGRSFSLGDLPLNIAVSSSKKYMAVTNNGQSTPVSYTHLRAHETRHDLVCRLLLEKKKEKKI